MADFLWPVDIVPASQTWKILDPAGQFQSPLSGAVRTVARAGARLSCTITVPPVKGADRARVMAVLSGLRGRSNRIWMPDFTTTQRGSMIAPELMPNNDFSSGATGWSYTYGSFIDRKARLTYTGNNVENDLYNSSGLPVTQYAPYALRTFVDRGTWASANVIGPFFGHGTTQDSTYLTTGGLITARGVVTAAVTGNAGVYGYQAGMPAGAYYEIPWMSFARCALVDNGPNALTNSDDASAWSGGGKIVTTNTALAPDGTTTADTLTEDTSTGAHYLVIAGPTVSAAGLYVGTVYVKRAVGVRNIDIVIGTTGSGHYITAPMDLGAGTVGSVGLGGSATNGHAYINYVGNNWYACTVAGWLPTAATRADLQMVMNSGGSESYTGTTGALYVWRASVAQSGVPVRSVQTTTSATSGTAQTGTRMYLKGLPPSTSGLLRVGDPVQIGNQLNFCTAQLDSDAAGLGVLQVGLPWRVSPADNDPVIFNRPMAKMLVANDIEWDTTPGQFSGFQLELVEDVT